mmetsp:Transcript_31299/g.96696  ORF Transcript_31299/g.96696 Transcript_31299/m.96696 type:complete len:269 (-) Transcript_31299:74-880(-)
MSDSLFGLRTAPFSGDAGAAAAGCCASRTACFCTCGAHTCERLSSSRSKSGRSWHVMPIVRTYGLGASCALPTGSLATVQKTRISTWMFGYAWASFPLSACKSWMNTSNTGGERTAHSSVTDSLFAVGPTECVSLIKICCSISRKGVMPMPPATRRMCRYTLGDTSTTPYGPCRRYSLKTARSSGFAACASLTRFATRAVQLDGSALFTLARKRTIVVCPPFTSSRRHALNGWCSTCEISGKLTVNHDPAGMQSLRTKSIASTSLSLS